MEQLEETKKEILIDNVLEWKKFKFLVALACSYMVTIMMCFLSNSLFIPHCIHTHTTYASLCIYYKYE